MVVPRYKLILLAAAVLIPCGLLPILSPRATFVSVGLILIFASVIAFDLLISVGSMSDIEIQLPETVRLSRDREGEIEVVVNNTSRAAIQIRLGLAFPTTFTAVEEEIALTLPDDAERTRYRWKCTPGRRGLYHLEKYYLERSSRLRLWDLRASRDLSMEIRVYPNLLKESKNLSALFLNNSDMGIHKQRLVGKGREFEKLRDYVPGDSYEDIHWKASAKRGKPVTKIYQTERTQEVYVLVDASRLSSRMSDPNSLESTETQLERFINAALIMGLAAEKQGDNFGVLTFSDRVHQFVRARNGKAHYGVCRDALYTLEPRTVSPDFEELFRFIRTRMTRRALLLVLTNLDDPVLAESFEHGIKLISRQHLVHTNMILPSDCMPLFSSPDVKRISEVYQALGGHQRWHELREFERTLKREGVDFSLIENERLCVDLVTKYMAVKQRQML